MNPSEVVHYALRRARLGNGAAGAYDAFIMRYARITTAAAAAAVSMGVLVSAPAQADPEVDAFLNAVTGSGVTGLDPATATAVGQQVCPMLAEPGQQLADVAGRVSESIGRPLGPATMFTGLAITWFCPGAVTALTDGKLFSYGR